MKFCLPFCDLEGKMAVVDNGVASVHYDWIYPTVDDNGDILTNVQGAYIEVRKPGSANYDRLAFVDFPKAEVTLQFTDDGMYAIRHIVVGSCSESRPSEAIGVSVDRRPPSQPESGNARVPCADAHNLQRS
jgi:hypothetical protein